MSEATRTDWRIVTRQLGRSPRAFSEVCRRCRYDYPQVILTEPLHRRGDRWEVFPTVYWLTCPLLHRAISRLEAEGQIRHYEERIRTDEEFAARMEQAHREAATDRMSLVPEGLREWLVEERPREARALAETGIAGIRSVDGVKCLHAHYADFVGRGNNPIGADVHRQLVERGVPPGGTDACWKFCSVTGARPIDELEPDLDRPQTQRRAVIDIGTNSVRLLVADVDASEDDLSLRPVWRNLAAPRLGRGVDRYGRLDEEAMIAAVDAVRDLAEQAREHGAAVIDVIGTSALRDAENRETFMARLQRHTGLAVRVLSGREEAAAAFLGAVRGAWPEARARGSEMVAVLDVGGGSTELVVGTADGAMRAAHSVDVGAVRMTELCVHSDPISTEDWGRLVAVTQAKLQPLLSRLGAHSMDAPGKLLAVGGTATTLAAMHQQLREYDPDRVHGYTLSRAQVARLIEALKGASVAERRTWPGLHPQRADIILAGAVIVHQVMAGLGAEDITVSESDLLEGVLLKGPVVDPRSKPRL